MAWFGFVFAPIIPLAPLVPKAVAAAATVAGAVGTAWSIMDAMKPAPEILWRDPPKPEAITDPTITSQAETGPRQTAEKPTLPAEQLLPAHPPTPLMETVEQTIQQPTVDRPEAPLTTDFAPDIRVEPIQGPNPDQYVGGWNIVVSLDDWPDDQYFQGSFNGVQDTRKLSAVADAFNYGVLTKFTDGTPTYVPYVQATYKGQQTYLWVSTTELSAVPSDTAYGVEIFRYLAWKGEYFSFTPEILQEEGGDAVPLPSTYVPAVAPAPVAEKKKEVAPLIQPQVQTIDLTAPNELVDSDATAQVWEQVDTIATTIDGVPTSVNSEPLPLGLAPPIGIADTAAFPPMTDDGKAPLAPPVPIPQTAPDVHIPFPGAKPVTSAGSRASLSAIAAELGRVEQKTAQIASQAGGGGFDFGDLEDLFDWLERFQRWFEQDLPEESFTLTSVCEEDAESGQQRSFTYTVPPEKWNDRLITMQRVVPALLQAHLGYKTPICGQAPNEKPELDGTWISTRWVSDGDSPGGTERLRKLFRYRSKSTRNADELRAYWSGFTWEAGPAIVWHRGAWWGEPKVWAASEAEGKRVLRFAAAEAGIDPDLDGEWRVGSSRSPRYGQTGTMRLEKPRGTYWVTRRDGPSGLPE